ncbi:hypothetical protein LSH36_130g02055 [Paralvinella palmiformis]|uniref:Ionotropic glutamate receptor C-terminal domain-containing protein n=1 Tax=Paralvinella palmiformis TaxID=53620 RepID=A0AAD9N9N8_9ANNE|nr:hypothetical protein LSH36_130g02055 [Paralvinella palmiformis]
MFDRRNNDYLCCSHFLTYANNFTQPSQISPYLEVRTEEPRSETEVLDDETVTSSNQTSEQNVTSSAVTIQMVNDHNDVKNTTSVTTAVPAPKSPYRGFIPDLMDLMLPFIPNITSYHIYVVEGDEENSAYTNMLKEVISGKADVAAGPMTVTINKEDYVDFTYPFQRVEATIVVHKTLGERITSLENLVNQDPVGEQKFINYGVREGSAIHKILQVSDDPLHKKMITHFNTNDVALKTTNAKGVNRARFGGYAFILEGSLADWVVGQPPCTLIGVKAGFFKRQYAFAVPQRSEWRDKLNRALVEVSSEMESLSEKWLAPGECSSANWLTPKPLGVSIIAINLLVVLLASGV